jgi:2-polyprenyl-6-methoxyphenol hydroxylase-like FAD-dependent oxidoreductase
MLEGMTLSKASTKGTHAVVLGGGIAGLATAGVLARHFERVTVVERDAYPTEVAPRLHTPQAHHVHILLAAGLVTLSKLVPDLPGWLDQLGFPEQDLTHHVRVCFEGRWLPKARSGILTRGCTRPTVEHLLRRDVARRDNVSILADRKVEGLLGSTLVRGVRVSRGGAEEDLAADLVVDAMGRGSPSLKWLAAMSVPAPEELLVDAGAVYSSCWFDAPRDIDDDWTMIGTLPAPPRGGRLGAVVRIGGDRLHFSAIEYGNPKPLHSPAELVAYAQTLSVPELHRLLRASRPTSDVSVFANTQNRWRRYGKLPWFPEGFVILGDAACSLNPRYGQGMTVASLGADLLDRELASYAAAHGHLRGFSHHFQKCLEKMLAVPWEIATMEDQQFVTAFSGASPSVAQRIAMMGSGRVLQTVGTDIDTYIQFMRVAQLLDPPTKMLSPRTIAKIARGGRSDAALVRGPHVGAGAAVTLESARPG